MGGKLGESSLEVELEFVEMISQSRTFLVEIHGGERWNVCIWGDRDNEQMSMVH